MEQEGDEVLAGGSLTLGCPCLADLVSCLVRGTHYTQEHISVYCPAGCKDIDGDIWGNPSQGYRDTSVLCKAAVHAGVIADEQGGQVTLAREKGITLYESAFANGLHSKRGSLSEKRLLFHKACADVLEVAAFNASSWWHEVDALGQDRAWGAQRAALSTTGHSWAAEPSSDAAWLELDLGTRRNITGIITKGSSGQHDYYVKSYCVSSSRDGKNWRPYRGSSGQEDKVFEGNTDSHGEVSNAFIPPIVGRYIRVTPQSWHQRMAMKVALLGCQSARGRAPRPYGSTLLLLLLIGGFVLLSSSLLVLAFLCRRKRKPAAELNCGTMKGHPKLDPSPVCSLQTLPPPGSTLASFPTAPAPGDLMSPGNGEIRLTGLGAHHPKKQQGREKPYDIKPKAQRIMNQFGPSTLINLSNFSSIKPEPASTPPQSSMANSTTVAKMPGTPSGGGRLSPESNQVTSFLTAGQHGSSSHAHQARDVLTKKKLQDLVREVDPNEQLDEDVEEMLLQIADDFIESVVTAACQLARHRKSNTLEVKDVQLHLERQWNMWIPGFGSEEIRPYKKACTTEAHKQRMALIRKTTKK
ncbi:discoidin, CUB and LCCL domain-containing protein 1-like protein [Amazona aestiva]|uniref:Transcription initiation factor TFIID subunit 12 n=1 Tax=Amazona aestiva TaxID=12930 RepID=A0A0Q3T5B6_AMAAE|nr:discoidin, CUB and LCCL domain-containing protein 1-like protein [Amazona aestiva]